MERLRELCAIKILMLSALRCCDLVLPLESSAVGWGLVFKDIFHQPRAACSLQCEEVCDRGKQALDPGHRILIPVLHSIFCLWAGIYTQGIINKTR